MSARARRKNRNRGLKKGFRSENGPTPRHKVRTLRDADLPDERADIPPQQELSAPRDDGTASSRDAAAYWTTALDAATLREFPDLFHRAVTDDLGAVALLHQTLETASQWCRRHGAHHCASELEEITARLSDLREDLYLAGETADEEITSSSSRTAAASRTSPAVFAPGTACVPSSSTPAAGQPNAERPHRSR